MKDVPLRICEVLLDLYTRHGCTLPVLAPLPQYIK